MSRRVGTCVLILVAAGTVTGCATSGSGSGTVVAAPAARRSATPARTSAVATTTAAPAQPVVPAPATADAAPTKAPATARAAPRTPSAPVPTVVEPVPAVPQGPSVAHWAGTWQRHGEEITLDADGNGTMVFRTYRWCSQDAPPCDSVNGNEIVDGGYATFHLSSVSTQQPVAGGYMDSTDEPVPLRPVTVADAYGNDPSDPARSGSITVTGLDADPSEYCAPGYSAPDNGCGP